MLLTVNVPDVSSPLIAGRHPGSAARVHLVVGGPGLAGFTTAEARQVVQQHTSGGVPRLYWYTDQSTPQREGVPLLQSDMERYLLRERAPRLFPS